MLHFGLIQVSGGPNFSPNYKAAGNIRGGEDCNVCRNFLQIGAPIAPRVGVLLIYSNCYFDNGAGSTLSRLLHSHYRTRTPEKYNRIRVKVTSGTEVASNYYLICR